MDNLSHSVVGLAVGAFVHRSLPQEHDAGRQRTRHRLLLISCWAASNFPDLDLVLTPLLPEPLGYLLHHRGHTHTLFYAIPQALALWGLILLLWPAARRLLRDSANARAGFGISLCLGFVLHMLMDFLNSYGIHPWHPFDSRWLYGDMVFIVEPVFWMAFGVPMAMMARPLALKALFLALLLGAPLYFTTQGFLTWVSFGALLLIATAAGALQHRAGERGRHALVFALCLGLVFIGMQGVASRQATRAVAATLQAQDPASRLHDAAMTSFPTNPLCWVFVSVESNEAAGSYRLRRGIVSLAPGVLPAAACPGRIWTGSEPIKTAPEIMFLAEEQGSLHLLRKLKDENCHFEAWLRFARTPAVSETTASDMRFSASPRGNFTTMAFADFSNRACARFIPGWDFPRADLLTPAAVPQSR